MNHKSKCIWCRKTIKSFNVNKDWENRKFHKKCYGEYMNMCIYSPLKATAEQIIKNNIEILNA
jgi:hypothetical protein